MTLEILGITADNEIAYRFDDGEVMTLTEDDLGVLTREITRDNIPLWPTQHCRHCGTDSVVVIDGDPLCEGHAMAYGDAENATVESERAS